MREAERLCVYGATPNKNSQATSSPAVPVESGVHVDHQALPQIAFLPKGFRTLTECGSRNGMCNRMECATEWKCATEWNVEEPSIMLRRCKRLDTRCCISRPEEGLPPSRDTRRRRARAHQWSCSGSPIAKRMQHGQRASCPAGPTPSARAATRPLRSP
jgi:hypothetical protein